MSALWRSDPIAGPMTVQEERGRPLRLGWSWLRSRVRVWLRGLLGTVEPTVPVVPASG